MSFLRGKAAIITGGGRSEPLDDGSAGIVIRIISEVEYEEKI